MRVANVVGARPQFIKAGAVSRALRATAGIREIIIHSGQHYDENMSDIFFQELKLPRPDYDLAIGSAEQGAQTGRMLEAIEKVLLQTMPDWVLVYGDTNTTVAGALAASKLHIPVAHVEAGLRSFNRRMPEEINRVVTDHVSDVLFAPTCAAVENLRREGVADGRVLQVGDVMHDVALYYGERAQQQSTILERMSLSSGQYVLVTVHRAENTEDPVRLRTICSALAALARNHPVVFPVHPRTRKVFRQHGLEDELTNVLLHTPLGYLDMTMLEKHAAVIATDSGGVQKEAFFHRVPCVTLREETEWLELIELGWNRLAPPTDAVTIIRAVAAASETRPETLSFPYGRGRAALAIVERLVGARTCATS